MNILILEDNNDDGRRQMKRQLPEGAIVPFNWEPL